MDIQELEQLSIFVDILEMLVNRKSMGNIKEIKRTLTLLSKITKYGIFLLSFLCTIYCGMIYLGLNLFGIHLLLFGFALVLRLTLSKVFNLCWIHKLCVVYVFLVSLCIASSRYDFVMLYGFDVKMLQGIMFAVGVILFLLLLWKAKDKTCD